MSDFILIFEVLKVLFFALEVTRYFWHRKREKALIESVESLNQRLTKLENVSKSKQLDE
jgi:hypothetical protein